MARSRRCNRALALTLQGYMSTSLKQSSHRRASGSRRAHCTSRATRPAAVRPRVRSPTTHAVASRVRRQVMLRHVRGSGFTGSQSSARSLAPWRTTALMITRHGWTAIVGCGLVRDRRVFGDRVVRRGVGSVWHCRCVIAFKSMPPSSQAHRQPAMGRRRACPRRHPTGQYVGSMTTLTVEPSATTAVRRCSLPARPPAPARRIGCPRPPWLSVPPHFAR